MSAAKVRTYLGHKANALFHSSPEEQERHKQTASLEQIARETINSTYHEDDPSVAEWFQGLVPSSAGVAEYVSELFPSAQWVRRYNIHWLTGDLVAGACTNNSTVQNNELIK
jgi:sodium-independent sulfate anion transporter 11